MNNELISKIAEKKPRLITGFVLFAVVVISAFILAEGVRDKYPCLYMFIIIAITVLAIVMYMIIINSVLHFFEIEKMYLICGLTIGILYLFIIPPYAAPDEEIHINSAYHFSNMLLFSNAGEEKGLLFAGSKIVSMPVSMRECDASKIYSQKVNNKNYEKYLSGFFEKTGSQDKSVIVPKRITGPVVLYCVSGTGMALARLFNMNYAGILFMGGLFNVILFVLSVYYSMKILPFGKRCLFAIAMFPVMLQQTSSISYDNIIISAAIIVTAIAIKYGYKGEMKRSMFIIYAISSFFLALSKSGAYFFIIFLPFVIGFSRQRLKKKNIIIAAVITFFVVLILARGLYTDMFYPQEVSEVNVSESGGAYIEWAQEYAYGINDYINNPLILLKIIKNTIIEQIDFLLKSMIATPLGWLNIGIPDIICYAFLIMMLLGTVRYTKSDNITIGNADRIVIWVVVLVEAAVCAAAMLLYWTPKSYDIIQGLQGRYFLPVLPMAALTMSNNCIVIRKNIDNIYMFVVILLQYLTIVHILAL